MTLDEAKQTILIESIASQAGYKLKKVGANELACLCPNSEHNDTNASCFINTAQNVFNCKGCGIGGSIVDWVVVTEGCTVGDAMRKLDVDVITDEPKRTQKTPTKFVPTKAPEQKQKVIKDKSYFAEPKYLTFTHEYKDGTGTTVIKVFRYDYPDGTKSFRLSHVKNGATVFGLKDVQRIPYNYDRFNETQEIFLVEGEKCADALCGIGLLATTTIAGSKSWMKEYAEYFDGKDLILIPDNDKAGRAFMKQVANDCSDNARSIRVLDMFPEGEYEDKYDVADWIDEHLIERDLDPQAEISVLANLAPRWMKGVRIGCVTAQTALADLKFAYESWENGGVDLKEIFPVLQPFEVRPLVGGDVLVVNAPTGAGKTAFTQLIAKEYNEHPVLWFSLELSARKMVERNLILSNRIEFDALKQSIMNGEPQCTRAIDHIYVDDNALADIKYIRKQARALPLVTGERARIIVIDYIQLMKMEEGYGNVSDYTRITHNAVSAKVLAKELDCVVIIVSQIGRKEEAGLNSAKGSGAIEESSTMTVGLNHDEDYPDIKHLGFNKNSNGDSGFSAELGWEGKYYEFSCTAQSRSTNHRLEGLRNEEEDEDNVPF